MIITFMTFAIVGTILAGIFVIIFGISVNEFNFCIDCFDCYRFGWVGTDISSSACLTGKVLSSFLMVLQLIEFCLTIATSIFCCTAVWCQPSPPSQVVFVPASGGMVQVPGGVIIGGQPGQTQIVHPQTFAATPAQAPGNMPQGWQQAPPPAYDGPIMATGVTAPDQNAGPLPEKN